MNKTMYKKILLGGLSLLVLAGCQKGLFENKGGRAVSFTATSGVNTKAAYAQGDGAVAGNKQRINWEAGDSLVIFSDRAETPQGLKFAGYTIDGTTIQTVGATSKAGLIRNEEAMLRYSETDKDPYTFVGVYPASGVSITDGVVTVRSQIPSQQTILANGFPDMKNGTQLLSNAAVVDWYQPVSLDFKPNFTSFEFTLAAEKSMKLTGFYVESDSNVLHGGYDSEIDLNAASPAWNTTVENGDNRKFIQVTFNTPLDMTLPEGETKTNEVNFGFYTFPKTGDIENISGLTFTFFLEFKEGEQTVTATRKLRVTYAKTEGGHNQGDPVEFEAGKKHNITGIVIPANLSNEIVIDLAVIPWEDPETDAIEYGPDAVVNALALEFASGAAKTEGGSRRRNNNFADDTHPINAYFSVFSPNDAQWKIKVTGDTDKLLVTADDATSTSTDDGLELTGAVGGRVHFKVDRAEGATITDATQIQLNFYVVVDGREISINSEITRANALTITGKVGN
ncbi:MAG: hypothetical protein IJM29_04085 [Bacteroidales bacterium]|nr:hypothetical protein [Bacteroidales bacterium]